MKFNNSQIALFNRQKNHFTEPHRGISIRLEKYFPLNDYTAQIIIPGLRTRSPRDVRESARNAEG